MRVRIFFSFFLNYTGFEAYAEDPEVVFSRLFTNFECGERSSEVSHHMPPNNDKNTQNGE